MSRYGSPLVRVLVVAAAAVALVALSAAQAGAKEPGAPLEAGWDILGAKVTCPGSAPYTMAPQPAAAFMQSWLPDSIFNKSIIKEKPPANLPVCTVAVDEIQSGTHDTLNIYVANNGTLAWVGADTGRWIRAPQSERVINSLAGKGTYVPPPAPAPTTTTTTKKADPTAKHSSSGSSAWPWVLLVLGIVVVGGGGAYALTRRGREPAAAKANPRR